MPTIGIFYEASDGALWLSTRGTFSVLRFDPSARSGSGGKAWTHYTPPQVLRLVYGIGQTADGAIWVGGGGALRRFDGETWTPVTEPEELTMRYADTIYSTPTGELWVGTRYYGAFHYDGKTWTQYDVWDGLADNRIMGILQTDEGSVWVATSKGISRFDGRTWTTDALPLPPDAPVIGRGASLLQSRDGALWINLASDPGRAGTIPLRTIRYEPDTGPPDTKITVSLDEVSQPGNTLLSWEGADPWKSTPDGELRYAWRLDDSTWSPFSTKINDVFLSLPAGDHTFEVKARDRDFNEDPTPAAVQFTVLPPVWQEPWFIGMVALFAGIIGVQATRILASNRRLTQSNTALSSANKDLFGMNKELQRDRAVERIRGEIQAMERASDFETVLSVLAEDLKTASLSFDTCGIDVLDEPVDDPTPAYFENHGFHYTSYTIEPDGAVNRETYHTPAPFPPVVRETVERFIAGEPWQGRSGQTAIVEVPASGYGRLRLTASDRTDFTDEEIASLQDFASAIALGYARYLDIREIQEQTERKSKFLASMSHELRTPMNAIIGFTRMVLRREKNISKRNKENLEKVRISADHLLELINDILDLSKIESGRMDVNPEPFDIGELISGCCAEVEPLVLAKPELKLTLGLPDGIGEANTDRLRLRQILLNLLSNAIKFTDRGEVAVRASVHGAGGEASLVIAVSDTGAGIPPDALESIFEEFQQVKGSDPEHKGTGLGLPITKGFAELMSGSVGVQSVVGKGSTFTVRVPVVYGGEG